MRNRAQNYIKILIGEWFFGKKFITLQLRKCAAPRHNSSELGSALGLRHFCEIS